MTRPSCAASTGHSDHGPNKSSEEQGDAKVKVHPGHSVREEPNSLAKSCEDSEDTQPYDPAEVVPANLNTPLEGTTRRQGREVLSTLIWESPIHEPLDSPLDGHFGTTATPATDPLASTRAAAQMAVPRRVWKANALRRMTQHIGVVHELR